MENDLISVIVPIYMAEKFVTATIDSIINQTYKHLEIILVDDGSLDRCFYICDKYAQNDERVKVIHKENGGLSSARNAGLDVAKGKYIVFVDADDILNENYVMILHDLCEKYDCDIAQCDFLMTEESSLLLPPQSNVEIKLMNNAEVMQGFCVESNLMKYWVAWNKMYRRELFDDIRYPIGRIHEDMYTSHKLLWKSKHTVITNQYLYYYYQRESSITGRQNDLKERIDVIEALKEEMQFFYKVNLQEEYEFMLIKFYCTICAIDKGIEEYSCSDVNKEKYTKIIKKYREEANELKKVFLNSSDKGMLTKIRTIYPTLDEEERKELEQKYGTRIKSTFINSFGFPVEKINKDDTIAIYGAGKVGCEFYNYIKDNEYGKVVVWVDNAFKNHIRQGLPVQPIDALFRNEFDKIIIAIQNRNVADEVKKNLVEWGVEESKIITDLPVPIDRGTKMRTEFIEDTKSIECRGNKERLILMNTPDHDNLGDHLLTMGTMNFIKDKFPQIELIEITGRQWDTCREDIIPKITEKDIIGIVGGGFMGDLWPGQDTRVKQILDDFKDNKSIFFPQTFFYIDNEKSILKDDVDFYNKRSNILYIHREKKSYEFFSENVVKNSFFNQCFPDMALYLEQNVYDTKRKNVLFCMRMDKESVNEDSRQYLLDLCKTIGKEVELIDTVLDRSVIRSERLMEVDKILKKVSSSELLITDRLHAMIMAVITGTPCIALNNLSGKVKGVYKWIEYLDYIICTDGEQIDADLINQFLDKRGNKYDREHIDNYFEAMAEFIGKWLFD